MSKQLVITAFVVNKQVVSKGGKIKYQQVSRKYHVRQAAEEFKALADKQAVPGETHYVSEVIGVEPE